jgi:hypothetical protein
MVGGKSVGGGMSNIEFIIVLFDGFQNLIEVPHEWFSTSYLHPGWLGTFKDLSYFFVG